MCEIRENISFRKTNTPTWNGRFNKIENVVAMFTENAGTIEILMLQFCNTDCPIDPGSQS